MADSVAGKVILTTVTIIAGLSVGLAFHYNTKGGTANPYRDEYGSGWPTITNTAQLVVDSDIIITGTIASATYRGWMSGYVNNQLQLLPGGDPDVSGFGLPVTDYQITPDYVFLDDGTIAEQDPVVLRLFGGDSTNTNAMQNPCAEDDMVPLNDVDETFLFFLASNPDTSYGLLYGASSRLDLSGTDTLATWCTPRVISWTENVAPSAFLSEVVAALP